MGVGAFRFPHSVAELLKFASMCLESGPRVGRELDLEEFCSAAASDQRLEQLGSPRRTAERPKLSAYGGGGIPV